MRSRWTFRVAALVAGLALVGGAGCATTTASTPSSEPSGAPAATTEPSAGSGYGRADEGMECDFGGRSDYTCRDGLQCCYPPGDETSPYGRCTDECE